jgi:hypothetical protein
MSTFNTPQMNDTFSRSVTTLVSFHRSPSRSTLLRIFFRYLSSCSSAGGTLRRHSSTTRCLVALPRDLRASLCLRTFSVWADIFLCNFSSFWGKAKLSSRSKTVSLSRGGKASQSSWYELLPEKDGLRESRGLFGVEIDARGVELPPGGEEPVDEVLAGTLFISGEIVLFSTADSALEPGMGMGSDISKMGRRLAVDDETPKETLRSRLPPLKTSPSAMAARVVGRRREEEGEGAWVDIIENERREKRWIGGYIKCKESLTFLLWSSDDVNVWGSPAVPGPH